MLNVYDDLFIPVNNLVNADWLPVLDAFRTPGALNSYINYKHLASEINILGV